MQPFIYHILFLIISIYVFLKVIGYALYEINTLKNKTGGIIVIATSFLIIIFSNIIIWLR